MPTSALMVIDLQNGVCKPDRVTFSKQDIAGNEIAGAQIQIKQGEEVVEK